MVNRFNSHVHGDVEDSVVGNRQTQMEQDIHEFSLASVSMNHHTDEHDYALLILRRMHLSS